MATSKINGNGACYVSFAQVSCPAIAGETIISYTATLSKSISYRKCMMVGSIGAGQQFIVTARPQSDTKWVVQVKNSGTTLESGNLYLAFISSVPNVTFTVEQNT